MNIEGDFSKGRNLKNMLFYQNTETPAPGSNFWNMVAKFHGIGAALYCVG